MVGAPPPANWYTDPYDAHYLRYWDGAAWTEHQAPALSGATTGGGAPQITLTVEQQKLAQTAVTGLPLIVSAIMTIPFVIIGGYLIVTGPVAAKIFGLVFAGIAVLSTVQMFLRMRKTNQGDQLTAPATSTVAKPGAVAPPARATAPERRYSIATADQGRPWLIYAAAALLAVAAALGVYTLMH